MEWGKYIIIVLILTTLGCNNNKNNQTTKEAIATEEVNNEVADNGKKSTSEDMDKYEQILKNNGFKFPSDEIYNKKIKEVFGLDLKDYAGQEFVDIKVDLESFEESNSFPEAIVNKKFIFWYPEANDDGWDDLAFVNINKYIFYNDKAALVYLRAKDGNAYIARLVSYFGYDYDKELINHMFSNSKTELKYYYSYFFGRKGFNGKLQLRREFFDIYFKANPKTDIYQSKFIDHIIDNKKYEGNKEADIAYLLNKMVVQCYAAAYVNCGSVDSYLDLNRYLREDFRKNKFYNFEELRSYIEYSYEVDYLNEKRKQIKDPDGYTNLRSGKSTSSEIVDKLKTGTYVEIIDDTEDWWYVEVMEGEKIREYKKGYVHKSKIVEQ